MKRAQFTDSAGWPELQCPKCGDEGYLHHGAVDIYDRRREDDKEGVHVHSNGAIAAVNTSAPMDGCPSPRRGGLTIRFNCEVCGSDFTLAIFQHKGKTYGGWIE